MILKSFAVFFPALIAGFGFVHLFWKSDRPGVLALKFFLGIGFGLGITSNLYFLRLLLFSGQAGYLLIEVIFLILVFIALFVRKRFSLDLPYKSLSLSRIQVLLGLAIIFVGAVALYFLVIYSRLAPHGDYDAQAIWNLRARFIYRSGSEWENAFSPLINRNFHMDYPLLIPLSVVGGWNTLGGEVLRVPAMLSMLFLFGMAGIIYCVISYLRSSSQAAIAVLLVLATPSLLRFSTFQTADIPLTYFFLASASLFILAGNENNRNLFFLSGLMAGLSTWTKNEGIPFAIIMMVCTLFFFGVRKPRAHLFPLLAGMIFPLLTLLLFKIVISLNNDLFTNNGLSQILSKIFDPSRYLQVFIHLLSELLQLGSWPLSIIIVLLVYAWIMGTSRPDSFTEKALGIIPLSQFVIYILIYVITPYDLEWHLNYSMSRLLIHLFPLGMLSFFLFVNTPETALNKVK
jgi:Dolichyl-phosphate-mannose-protein mannosyltransferase